MGLAAKSFDQFVDAHVGELLRTACLITWDDAEAEDLVQECLLKIAHRWPRVSRMDMPAAYARRILINLTLAGGGRRARRRHELGGGTSGPIGLDAASETRRSLEDVDASAELAFTAVSDRAELMDALGRISPQQRAVLVLRYFHDQSEEQVAALLGCGVGTVKSSASRGLARLRELIGTPCPPSPSEVTNHD